MPHGVEGMHTVETIIAKIEKHMDKVGGKRSEWYVGITSDIEERLFGFHRVQRKGGRWIHCKAANDADAREAEAAFHEAGCQGAGGGGDHTAVHVYAYPVAEDTVE